MFKKILVALDSTPISQNVFAEAVSLAKASDAKLHLIHILSAIDDGYPLPIYPGVDSLYSSMHEEAVRAYARQWEVFERESLELLKSLCDRATEAGVVTEYSQHVGDPGEAICRIADTWKSDLIILGRRGRVGLAEIFLGSVSNYVLHHAPCSVLTIQGRGSEVGSNGAASTPKEASAVH